MTPKKYRDRLFDAVVVFMEAPKRTPRQRQNAVEDLMVVFDTVIEECRKDREHAEPS